MKGSGICCPMMTIAPTALGGFLAGTLLLFNGAPRCVPRASLLLNISDLLDADHVDQDRPRSRVHCEELKTPGKDESPPGDEQEGPDQDCRCTVVAVAIA